MKPKIRIGAIGAVVVLAATTGAGVAGSAGATTEPTGGGGDVSGDLFAYGFSYETGDDIAQNRVECVHRGVSRRRHLLQRERDGGPRATRCARQRRPARRRLPAAQRGRQLHRPRCAGTPRRLRRGAGHRPGATTTRPDSPRAPSTAACTPCRSSSTPACDPQQPRASRRPASTRPRSTSPTGKRSSPSTSN